MKCFKEELTCPYFAHPRPTSLVEHSGTQSDQVFGKLHLHLDTP